MNLQSIKKEVKKRNQRLKMYEDYYHAEGRQWLLKGQITRSGQYLVDKLDLSSSTANFFNDLETQDWIYETDLNDRTLEDTTRKRRYAEANVIDFAIDEASRVVRGVGEIQYQVPESTFMTKEFTKYMNNSNFIFNVGKISKQLEKYGFIPVFIGEDKWRMENPYNFYFIGDEEDNNLEAFEIKAISISDAKEFFMTNFGFDLQEVASDSIVEFMAHYTKEIVEYYIGDKVVFTINHNIGMSPVQRFKHDGGSSISKMIAYQDAINIILTETSEVFKANLNPVVHIGDTKTNESAKQYANKNGKNLPIERAPGSVMITDSEGRVQYVTWDGIPTGTIEVLKKYEDHFYNKRGISLFSENNGLAESGKAKDEQKDQLRNIALEIRQEIELGIKNIFNVWLGIQGFSPDTVEVLWSSMTETSEKEKTEIELQHYAVHGNKEVYLRRIGTFSDEEIEMILKSDSENEIENEITT